MFRASFTEQEWRTLQMAPIWVSGMAASADGQPDRKEAKAWTEKYYEYAKRKPSLVQEVLQSVLDDFDSVLTRYTGDLPRMLAGLVEVSAILDRKATRRQGEEFRSAMMEIGRSVARATGGGLFGIGDRVSSEEQYALALIELALHGTA